MVIKRSLSDGNIPCESDSPEGSTVAECDQPFSENRVANEVLSEFAPVISTCENNLSCCRSALHTFHLLAISSNMSLATQFSTIVDGVSSCYDRRFIFYLIRV